jgi:hypothetical protein
VYIKKLYVQGKFDDAFVLRVGATDLPWITYLESFYGYRYVEKLALDRLGLGTTSDWGLNINGKSGVFDYSASVVNGGGYKNPTRTKDVDFEGRIGVKPIEWLILAAGVYSGHLGQINASNSSFPSNTATRFDFAAAVNYEGLRLGREQPRSRRVWRLRDRNELGRRARQRQGGRRFGLGVVQFRRAVVGVRAL